MKGGKDGIRKWGGGGGGMGGIVGHGMEQTERRGSVNTGPHFQIITLNNRNWRPNHKIRHLSAHKLSNYIKEFYKEQNVFWVIFLFVCS